MDFSRGMQSPMYPVSLEIWIRGKRFNSDDVMVVPERPLPKMKIGIGWIMFSLSFIPNDVFRS